MSDKIINIGGASGFWGDAARATPQLIASGQLDYIVYDYLAEITMSIMARARAKDASKGYALDFVSVTMAGNLSDIAAQKIKVISNAGGVNPAACAAALRAEIDRQGLALTVACVLGDDLISQRAELAARGITEMFSQESFPDLAKVQSINAYLGAFPIAEALSQGADIVITGRSVDSAVTLGACIHAFGWQADQYDQLAMGSLAGHILECGPQATGGNFTDWEQAGDLENIGYPIAEVSASGEFVCTKPAGTSGLVSRGTVAEQLVYEIGDPQAYLLPDVACDFSGVQLAEIGPDRVRVSGAVGYPSPPTYKVCATYADEFRGGTYLSFYGIEADRKARALGETLFRAANRSLNERGLPPLSETSIELIGAESQYGEFAEIDGSREVAMKVAAKHPSADGIAVFLREASGLGLATPPGLSGFQGGRAKPSPVVRLFSFALPKQEVQVVVDMGEKQFPVSCVGPCGDYPEPARSSAPDAEAADDLVSVPLVQLAWGRSGDKGNKANIGIIARREEYFPYIAAALSIDAVAQRFAHFLDPKTPPTANAAVERFVLPGLPALNFLLHAVLGGGGIASLRNDAQGKGYAQLLLQMPVSIPADLIKD
ncbi:MAG: DUF1446 domain-containing protein [Gammaproteobacteria bacterium]|nr:DUF1446 domain-containing protein [Gammaproteobacteria bacterium]